MLEITAVRIAWNGQYGLHVTKNTEEMLYYDCDTTLEIYQRKDSAVEAIQSTACITDF